MGGCGALYQQSPASLSSISVSIQTGKYISFFFRQMFYIFNILFSNDFLSTPFFQMLFLFQCNTDWYISNIFFSYIPKVCNGKIRIFKISTRNGQNGHKPIILNTNAHQKQLRYQFRFKCHPSRATDVQHEPKLHASPTHQWPRKGGHKSLHRCR